MRYTRQQCMIPTTGNAQCESAIPTMPDAEDNGMQAHLHETLETIAYYCNSICIRQ